LIINRLILLPAQHHCALGLELGLGLELWLGLVLGLELKLG